MHSEERVWQEADINDLLVADPVDVRTLRRISRQPGGFLSNNIRAKAWAKLVQVNRTTAPSPYEIIEHTNHRDTAQILCDIERSLWHFENTTVWKNERRNRRRAQLSAIIHAVLIKHPHLHYYQGYHDLISVFLLVCGDVNSAFAISQHVSLHYLADWMAPDFTLATKEISLIFPLIKQFDLPLYNFITESQLEPYVCISWVITWFSHDLSQLETVARLFDVFICSHPLFVLYLSAQVIHYRRDEVLSSDCEFTELHKLLLTVPRDLPWDDLIASTDKLMNNYPPRKLEKLAAADLLGDIRRKRAALFLNPEHLSMEKIAPDWLLAQSHRTQVGKSRSTRALRRKRLLALQAETRLALGIERTKFMRNNEDTVVAVPNNTTGESLTKPTTLIKPALIVSVAAAVLAIMTYSGNDTRLLDFFGSL